MDSLLTAQKGFKVFKVLALIAMIVVFLAALGVLVGWTVLLYAHQGGGVVVASYIYHGQYEYQRLV